MGYSSFEMNLTGDGPTRAYSTRLVAVLGVATLVIGFTIGILVGHYAISSDTTSGEAGSPGTADEIVGGQQTTTLMPTTATTNAGAVSSAGTTDDGQKTTTLTPTTATTDAGVVSSERTTFDGVTTVCITQSPSQETTGRDVSTTTASTEVVTSDTETTSEPERVGVFLEGVSEAIIREADPNVTDWILGEINATNIRQYLKDWVKTPHIAGTARDLAQAEELQQFWQDNGLDKAYTTPYDILLSYPSDTLPNKVRLLNGTEVVLESPKNEENLTPAEWSDSFPFPYLGYSGNGNVTVNLARYYTKAEEVLKVFVHRCEEIWKSFF